MFRNSCTISIWHGYQIKISLNGIIKELQFVLRDWSSAETSNASLQLSYTAINTFPIYCSSLPNTQPRRTVLSYLPTRGSSVISFWITNYCKPQNSSGHRLLWHVTDRDGTMQCAARQDGGCCCTLNTPNIVNQEHKYAYITFITYTQLSFRQAT